MFEFLETLEMRGHLKAYQREDRVVIAMLSDGGIFSCRIVKVGWASVTVDVVDGGDETTWMARWTLPISMINSVNESSVSRMRHKLMMEHDGHTCGLNEVEVIYEVEYDSDDYEGEHS